MTKKDNLVIEAYSNVVLLTELTKDIFWKSKYFKEMSFQDNFIKKEIENKGIGTQGSLYLVLYTMIVMPLKVTNSNLQNNVNILNKFLKKYRKNKKSNLNNIEIISNAVTEINIEFDKNSVSFNKEIIISFNDMNLFLEEIRKFFIGYINYLKNNQ